MLLGKIALLSGATRGVGAEVTLALAREGADVCLLTHNAADAKRLTTQVESMGRRALSIPCMVEDQSQLDEAYGLVEERLGECPDIVFTNMGMMPPSPDYPRKTMFELTESDWDRYLNNALRGVVNSTNAACRAMAASGKGGTIVNTAPFGLWAGKGLGLYSASRAAILSMVDTVNCEAEDLGYDVRAYLVDCERKAPLIREKIVTTVVGICSGKVERPGLVELR